MLTINVLHPEILPEAVRMLVLFGSRVKGNTHAHSDWDVGYVGPNLNTWADLALYGKIADALGIPADRLDLVDLRRCSPLLGYVVAREGSLIYEADLGLFADFQRKAWKQYADTAKFRQLQRGYIRSKLEEWR